MNKNKVAVLLSGHVRSYESLQQVVEGIEKNLIKINPEYDFKFFIYTWSKLDWLRDGTSVSSNTNTDRNKIYDIIKFEDILIGEFTNPILINGSDRIYGQYSSVYKCNELKKNFEEKNYKFDICIRTRLDLKICEPIDLSSLDYSCYNITKDAFGFADWFCISSSELIDYYSILILSLEKLVDQVNSIGGFIINNGPDPHTILQMHLKNKGHELKKSDLDDLGIHNSLYDENFKIEKYINRIDFLYYLIRSDGRPNDTFKKGYR